MLYIKSVKCESVYSFWYGFMRGFVNDFKEKFFKKPKNSDIEPVKKHLEKYLKELKLHFNLSDDDILKILSQTYYSNKPKNPVLKYLNMLKYWN